MSGIEIVIYTTNNSIEILYVTLPRVINFFSKTGIRINVVSNTKNDIYLDFPEVNFIFTDVNFDTMGTHFSDMMKIVCNTITSDYLLFLVDDYIFNSTVNKTNFDKIFDLIVCEDIDYFSFQSVFGVLNLFNKWDNYEFDKTKYNFGDIHIKKMDGKFKHCLSVQPSIWKIDFIKELITDNPSLTLSQLDNRILNKTKNDLLFDLEYSDDFYHFYDRKLLSYYFGELTNHIDERKIGSDFFMFDYGEIIRHGKIIESETNSKKIVMDEINNNEILKIKLKKFL